MSEVYPRSGSAVDREAGIAVKRGARCVAEDYSQIPRIGPSLSRKGGIRLHPIRDGVIPTTRTIGGLVPRDRGGNLYTEITNPNTGMCMGVTSPLTIEGGPVLDPTPVVPVHNPVRDGGLFPQLVGDAYVLGVGANRRVIRTVADGDKPLPPLPAKRASAARAGSSTNDGPPRPPRAPRVSRQLIDAYIQALAEKKAGRKLPPVKIDEDMRRMARLAIERQEDIKRFCAND